MLSVNDKKVLDNVISQMGSILNATPGEVFQMKDADTLLILQRRIPESDLKNQLIQFNEIFARTSGVGIPDITNSMIAYLRIKVLLAKDTDEFDGFSYRELFKECKSLIARTDNIIRLTKANLLTAEEYQKHRINVTIQKNEAFIACLENELEVIEKKLERFPKEEIVESENQENVEPVKEKKRKKESKPIQTEKKVSLASRFEKLMSVRADRKVIDKHLRDVEKDSAITSCEEIPYYDRKLQFTDYYVCKDIPTYSIILRKNNIYFGLTKNVGKGSYDNSDGALMELTNAPKEFVQFMTADLLSGEYDLKPFSDEEKLCMQMYFDFMTRCFEKHIGVTLTAREYMDYKNYYNRLVMKMLELEQMQKDDYYRALPLADRYLFYMNGYCMECAESSDDVIKHIMADEVAALISDLELILENHIVEEEAKEEIKKLCDAIRDFHKKEVPEVTELAVTSEDNCPPQMPQSFVPLTIPMGAYPYMPGNVPNNVTQNIMQIVVQILDAKHEVIDEALYAGNNIQQALSDYERKDACIKRLGFRNNGVDVFYKEEVKR